MTALEATADDVVPVAAFAASAVAQLEAPRRRADRILFRRWSRFAAVAATLVLAFVGVRAATLGPNLVADNHFRTSSSWSGCAANPPCLDLLFHTDHQSSPWVEFDLGEPKTFRRIEVSNRTDCCSERAVPLVAEVSNDRVKWTEVARQDAEFSSWTAKLKSTKARYVRLRVPRDTVFHLKAVAIR